MCANRTTTRPATIILNGSTASSQPYTYDNRTLAPLHESIKDVLNLTAKEHQSASIFALAPCYHGEVADEVELLPRFAVCVPVPATQLSTLTYGDAIIFSVLYQFLEADGPFEPGTEKSGIPRALASRVGAVRANDTKRGLLYTSLWDGGVENDQDNTYAEIHEVWLVQRFITAL